MGLPSGLDMFWGSEPQNRLPSIPWGGSLTDLLTQPALGQRHAAPPPSLCPISGFMDFWAAM